MKSEAKLPRIAIPVPHSGDPDYAEHALPVYLDAVLGAGGEPVRIELGLPPAEVLRQIEHCDAVLLPGSRADVDPEKYRAARDPKTDESDAKREAVDALLLRDAYKLRKPVLGICYGLQSLNVFRAGTLVQDVPTANPESKIDHSAGREVPKAHHVLIEPGSRLAAIVGAGAVGAPSDEAVAVNSSHHQAADIPGEGLRVVAHCAEDGTLEALEGTDPGHFVVAVQWHPERSVNDDPEVAESAKAIFRAFIAAARARQSELSAEAQTVR
jgi:putative glutamine amidotransferase